METKRYKPLIDKLYWIITLPTVALMLILTVITAIFHPPVLWIMVPSDLFVGYFLICSLFGYVEFREKTLFIRYGFFMTKEIPYEKIRGMEKCRKWYADGMMALKHSLDHVNIKYNTFDVTTVSVKDNDAFIREWQSRTNI